MWPGGYPHSVIPAPHSPQPLSGQHIRSFIHSSVHTFALFAWVPYGRQVTVVRLVRAMVWRK